MTNRIFERNERTLLIGRQHMQTWYTLNKIISQKTNRVDSCYLLNKTRDDNYLLYAAIQHPETKILSGDLFRDHRNKFEEWYLQVDPKSKSTTTAIESRPNLPRIFSRWLRSRQIRIDENHRLDYPNEFDMRIHVHEDPEDNTKYPSFHIPIVLRQDCYDNADHVYEWICARHS